jgi:cytochrome c oxidase subunit 4
MNPPADIAAFRGHLRRDAAWFLGALAPLALNVAAAFLPLGRFHGAATVGLCLSQALPLLLYWMDLRRAETAVRLCAILPAAWLVLLIGLSWADLLTRQVVPPPW